MNLFYYLCYSFLDTYSQLVFQDQSFIAAGDAQSHVTLFVIHQRGFEVLTQITTLHLGHDCTHIIDNWQLFTQIMIVFILLITEQFFIQVVFICIVNSYLLIQLRIFDDRMFVQLRIINCIGNYLSARQRIIVTTMVRMAKEMVHRVELL